MPRGSSNVGRHFLDSYQARDYMHLPVGRANTLYVSSMAGT